jgi:UDP-3-O-[3-hydroxymyristoyl] N-acetylglucosamine deacetylase
MSWMQQKTIRNRAWTEGVGIHSGARVRLTLVPAGPDEGVGFIREDLGSGERIPALFSKVHNTELATTLTEGGASVATVEHLTAALFALGVDNVTIELSGPEVPILDGSAAPFAALITEAGIVDLGRPGKAARVTGPVRVESDGGWAELIPADGGLSLDYTIVYDNPHIGTQRFVVDLTPEAFITDVAPARTFGLYRDVESMYARGLAQGGTLENAVVINDDGVINPDGLRFPDECVRHKCLDAVGDLSLVGMPLIGGFRAYRSGHRINHLLVRKLFTTGAYEIVAL